MRRYVFILMALLLFLSTPAALADFNSLYQDYLFAYGQYNKAYQSYVIARNQYLTYKTLTSENEALNKTKELLTTRDSVLLTYFSMLDERFATATGLSTDQVNLEKELNSQALVFINEHKSKINSVGSLNDALALSNLLEDKSIDFEIRGKETASVILAGKIQSGSLDMAEVEGLLDTKINLIKAQGKDVGLLERWLLELKNKGQLAQLKYDEATSQFRIMATKNSEDEMRKQYLAGQNSLLLSKQYLNEAVTFAKELVGEIKKGNYLN